MFCINSNHHPGPDRTLTTPVLPSKQLALGENFAITLPASIYLFSIQIN